MQTSRLLGTMFAAAITLSPLAALAGPCSDDIADLGRKMSQSPAMGPPTTGALSGSGPGSVVHGAQPSAPDSKGTSADNRVGGTAGTTEVNAASAGIATSDADVRQQQMGHPTAMAASGKSGVETTPGHSNATASNADDHMSKAKMAWQKAVDLNAKNDDSCKGAVNQAREALKAG